MEVLYKRESGHNYLLFLSGGISEGSEVPEETSQIEMVRRNNIEGLASLHVEWENNQKYYGYDITGMQPFSRILEFRLLTEEEVRELLSQLAAVIIKLEQYLLDRDKLVLDPEYIYVEIDSLRYLFFFYPEHQGVYGQHMKELARFLLEKVSADDPELLTFLFRFYRLCSEKEPEPEILFSCLSQERKKEENRQSGNIDIRERKQDSGSEICEKKEKKKRGFWESMKDFLRKSFHKRPYDTEEMWDELEPEYIRLMEKENHDIEERQTELLYREESFFDQPVLCCRERNEKVPVNKFPFFIGMQSGADYSPGFGAVSRLHLKLEKKDGKYWITDLNSTNGTKLNGDRLFPNEEREVVQGDIIWIAGLSYEFTEFDREEKSW